MKKRTIFEFPNAHVFGRQVCAGGFYAPSIQEIADCCEERYDYFSSSKPVLILPVHSLREELTFRDAYMYAESIGFAADRIVVIYSRHASKLVDTVREKSRKVVAFSEEEILEQVHLRDVKEIFGADLSLPGKGRAIFLAFVAIHQRLGLDPKEVYFLDTDSNMFEFRPLHYLGWVHMRKPDKERFAILTAQNNELRDNHYLFQVRDIWRSENEIGRIYARHLDEIVWPLTGELMLAWHRVGLRVPFCNGYGIETLWQFFAAEEVCEGYSVSQVVNPNPKIDGGNQGRSGQCYDSAMFRQLNFLAWAIIKHGIRLHQMKAADFREINGILRQQDRIAVLPSSGDHGPPFDVGLAAEQLIPSLGSLLASNCLRVKWEMSLSE